jgi:hypothetical protein
VAQNVLYEYAGQRYTVQMPANGDFRPGVRIALQVQNQVAPAVPYPPVTQVYAPQPAYTHPVQTVTYVQPAPTVVYYDTYDTYRPRYIYNSTPYYSNYYAPRAVQRPVQVINYPVRPHHGHDDYRNWR